MSRKNHKMIGGRLLQTDKKFSALKQSQQTKIHDWLKEEYLKMVGESKRILTKAQEEELTDRVYAKIEECDIWIPYYEVRNYLSSKLVGWNKKHLQ